MKEKKLHVGQSVGFTKNYLVEKSKKVYSLNPISQEKIQNNTCNLLSDWILLLTNQYAS